MLPPGDNFRIDSARLWDSIHEIAKIGPGVAGGNNRQALTDEDGEARRLFRAWCEAAGLAVAADRMGTMYAVRPGAEPGLLPVCVGSHLDTQPTGGRYDGVLGVLAGLEMVRTLNDLGIKTRHPVMVVNWTNEEGARFAPAMLASGVYAGNYDEAFAHSRTDASGRSFAAELDRIGWMGDEPAGARRMHAYFELHIEQGPILEAEGKTVGIVTHGQGLAWVEVTVEGVAAHTGSTPMAMRRNAGLGMSRIIALVDEIALSHAPVAVGAVGRLAVEPNSPNVIPGRAVFTVDFRSPDKTVIAAMERELADGARAIADSLGLTVSTDRIAGFDPVAFDPGCVGALREAAHCLGYTHRDIVSGAGHDACWVASVAPAAMVMCPCVGGLSHNEAEAITPEWAAAGADVLMRAVLDMAGIVDA